jgi:hypothetical protein
MWRTLILLAGLAGIAGFFLPLRSFSLPDNQVSAEASAFQVVRGTHDSTQLFEQAQKLGLSKADAERMTRSVNAAIRSYRAVLIGMFAPSALLVLLGLVEVARRRTGRFAGLLAIVLGMASVAGFIAILLLVGDLDVNEHTVSLKLGGTGGVGSYCLLGSGVVAMFAGLGALLRPEPD